MNIIAVTQARIGSSRLPGKVLKLIEGRSILEIHLRRLLISKQITKLKVATTLESGAVAICNIARQLEVDCYCGDTDDVLDRFYQAVKEEHPDYIVRITSDCPLIDADLIDELIAFAVTNQLDYASNTLVQTSPDGLDAEVFTFKALQKAWSEATLQSDREHVTPYIWRNSTFKGGQLFVSDNLRDNGGFGNLRITIDEDADFQLLQHLISELGIEAGWKDYVQHLDKHPEIARINSHIIHNEGYLKSLKKD